MIKQLFFLVIFLSVSIISSGQYFVSEGSIWSYSEMCSEGLSPRYYWLKFQGDTSIAELDYKHILRSSDSQNENWERIGFIREDSLGRVYRYKSIWSDEKLSYDFSLKPGDSIKTPDFTFIVDSVVIKSFGESTIPRKHIYSEAIPLWIEGLGSLVGPINGGADELGTIGMIPSLLCYFEHDELVYHNDDFSSCFPVSAPSTDMSAKELKVVATKGTVRFSVVGLDTRQAQLYIHDISGRLVYHRTLTGESSWEVPTKGFLPGVYVYRLSTTKGLVAGKFYAY